MDERNLADVEANVSTDATRERTGAAEHHEWLYRIVPRRPGMPEDPTEAEAQLVNAHFRYLQSLRERGIVVLAGRTQDRASFGIVVFRAENAAKAERIMQDDPAVAEGIFTAELHPFHIAIA